MYIDILRPLGMRSEGNALKNGEPTDSFSSTTMLQHTSRFWSRISHQRTLEHPPYSPDLAPADFYLFPRLRSALKGRRLFDATDIINNATEELKRLSEMVSEDVSNSFTVADRSAYSHKGTILKEM